MNINIKEKLAGKGAYIALALLLAAILTFTVIAIVSTVNKRNDDVQQPDQLPGENNQEEEKNDDKTDGENNAGGIHPATAASFFRSSGISLILAGLGRKGYSEISYEDPVSGMQYSGRFYSGFDETSLLDIAAAAGGIYVRAADPDSLASVFSTLDASVPETAVAWSENARRSLSFPCAVLSLCFAAAAWMLRFLLLGGGICL